MLSTINNAKTYKHAKRYHVFIIFNSSFDSLRQKISFSPLYLSELNDWSISSVPPSPPHAGSTAVPSPASKGFSLRRNGASKPRQAKMTQMSGLVRLGRREVSRSHSPTFTDEEELRSDTPPPPPPHPSLYTHTMQVREHFCHPSSIYGLCLHFY